MLVSFVCDVVGVDLTSSVRRRPRNYATLAKFTEDVHPEVRRVGVHGVSRVLAAYWEMVPMDKITLLLDALLLKAGELTVRQADGWWGTGVIRSLIDEGRQRMGSF